MKNPYYLGSLILLAVLFGGNAPSRAEDLPKFRPDPCEHFQVPEGFTKKNCSIVNRWSRNGELFCTDQCCAVPNDKTTDAEITEYLLAQRPAAYFLKNHFFNEDECNSVLRKDKDGEFEEWRACIADPYRSFSACGVQTAAECDETFPDKQRAHSDCMKKGVNECTDILETEIDKAGCELLTGKRSAKKNATAVRK